MTEAANHASHDVILSVTDRAILRVLTESPQRIVGRESLVRLAGLDNESARRADGSVVVLRRAMGQNSIINVRARGWMLSDEAFIVATNILAHEI